MGGTCSNIDIKQFRKFLKSQGLEPIGVTGGHEKWKKAGLLRPVIFQTHINPIPLPVVKNNLRTMNCTIKDLEEFLK